MGLKEVAVLLGVIGVGVCEEVVWVLFEVGDEGVRVAEEGMRPGAVSRSKVEEHEAHFSVVLRSDEGAEHSHIHFADPRFMHHEHIDPVGDDWNGTVVKHPKGYIDARLPSSTHSMHIHFNGQRTTHVLSRKATPLEDAPTLYEIQTVANVNDTLNIVFLSGCYAEASRAKFLKHVDTAVRFLTGVTTAEGSIDIHGTPLSSQPWNRYFTHFNIFAVFEASPQDGANHPNPDGSIPDPRPNKLQCSYGTTIKRMLSCNFAQTRALASHAPASDIILTLVNDEEYGGAGGSGQAAIYTGENFQKVLIHEMGHAAGDLSDEYDYGFAESANWPLKNCDKANAPPFWSKWQAKWAAQGKPYTPLSVCSYTNYYRPTDDCLMRSSAKSNLCDVCREALLKNAIFSKNIDLSVPRCPLASETLIVKETSVGYLHVNPQIQDKFTYVTNEKLWGPPFKILWGCVSAPSGVPCPSVLPFVNGTDLVVGGCSAGGTAGVGLCGWGKVKGDYTVQVTVVDTVDQVGWTDQGEQSVATFTFKIVDDAGFAASNCNTYDCNARYGKGTGTLCQSLTSETTCVESNCYWQKDSNTCRNFFTGAAGSGDAGYKICTLCNSGDTSKCNITFHAHPQEAEAFSKANPLDINPVNVNNIADKLGTSMYFVLFSAAIFGATMLFALYRTCSKTFAHDRNEAKYTECNQALRVVIMILFTVLVWGAVGVVGYGVYLFIQTEMEIWGSVLIILIIVSGAVIFSLSFFVFGAVASREKWKLCVSGVLLTLATILMVILSIIVHSMAQHASDGAEDVDTVNPEWEAIKIDELGVNIKWMEELRDLWQTGCKDSPTTVCKFEQEMKCSGFQKSCYNIAQNSYCPKECPLGNAYVNPCVNVIQRKLADNFTTATVVSVSMSAALGFGMILVWFLFGSLFCCANRSVNSGYSAYKHPAKATPTPMSRPAQNSPNFGRHPQRQRDIEMGSI